MARYFTPLFLLLLLGTQTLPAQGDLRIGDWKIYHPYRLGTHITQGEDRVYYTSQQAVVAFDKRDPSSSGATFITKLDGLSEAKTRLVKYSPLTDALIVTYTNSEFDLVSPGRVTTFNNLRNDGNFFNRTINEIAVLKDSMAYFCMAYGIVEFNLVTERFGFTANLGIEVFGITWKDGRFFAATEEGVYRAEDRPGINLKDNANWQLLDLNEGFPGDYSSSAIVNYRNNIYVDVNDGLYKYTESGLDSIYHDPEFFIRFLTAEGDHLLLGLRCIESCDGRMLIFDETGNYTTNPNNCVDRPRYGIEDQYGQLWFADSWWLYRILAEGEGDCRKVEFDAPFDAQVNELTVHNGELWATSEIISTSSFTATNQAHGFYHLSADGQWTNFHNSTNDVMRNNEGKSCYTVAVNPENNKVYVGTLFNGLIEYDPTTEELRYFNEQNSVLEPAIGDFTVRIGGLAFDEEGNLWMSNNRASNPIAVLKADGTFQNRFSGSLNVGAELRSMVIDQNGYKWFTRDKAGIVVYDDAGTLDIPGDDRVLSLNSTNTQIPNDNVRSIAVDLDGEVWVGTKEGVVIFDCGAIFDSTNPCVGFKQPVEVGGIRAFLLESEDVLAIAVDGANRKWFGTENGVFVQSPDGKEAIAYLNEDNSPLLDNVVYDIAIDQVSGEVYLATAKGITSLRAEAVEGAPFHNEAEIYAFPNPVKADYEGPIAIKGLTRDANVKITDVNGQLIYETTALGGQAIWDGRDYNGRRASSGVYLVFSTSTDTLGDPDAIVTKILVMN
ncbi:MAG: hypothetical protein AAFR05_01035 [Bacteroidota bacterium]